MMIRFSFPLFLGVLVTLLFILIALRFFVFNPLKMETVSSQDSSILLERINKVYKMVLVEGEFTELLSHRDYYGYDLPGFRKKAIIKIQAKVLAGYNLDSLKIVVDETNKVLKLQKWPSPEILAIDSDISYYDIDNGWFNSFTPEELTKLTRDGKDLIRKKAEESTLLPTAEKQAIQMLEMIQLLAESSGYRVEIDPKLPVNRRNSSEKPTSTEVPIQIIHPIEPSKTAVEQESGN